jgi:hypothetical protein
MVAAQPKETPMTKAKSKRTTACKAVQPKSVIKPAARQRRPSASQPTARHESKKAHIIAMLRAPGGVTIEAMARAAKWQPHSVRGFLAGVVRKKLGLTLVSEDVENGRVYRITDRTASAAA